MPSYRRIDCWYPEGQNMTQINPFRKIIDRGTIKSWISKCDRSHGEHCQSPHKTASNTTASLAVTGHASHFGPQYLIDVHDQCLKSIAQLPFHGEQRERRYVALSYVWGSFPPNNQSPILETTVKNLDTLLEKGAFKRSDVAPHVPLTIQHVMALTRLLDERYLWVDRFCIVQDADTKISQINAMAQIYAGAYLTIIAASGDAYSGIHGIDWGISPQRSLSVVTETLMNRTPLSDMLADTEWSRRAWTLQERLFSRRAIYIFEGCVVWECHCEVEHEFRPAGKRNSYSSPRAGSKQKECINRFSGPDKGLQFSPWPDLREYHAVVRDYCSRRLTFPEDAVAALSGVTTTLSHSFRGGFHYGLTELFFGTSLLWCRPRRGSWCTRRRRRASPMIMPAQPEELEAPLKSKQLDELLPSWSWMSLQFTQGTVDLAYCESACDYIHESKRDSIPSASWSAVFLITPLPREWRLEISPESAETGNFEGAKDHCISHTLHRPGKDELQSKLEYRWKRSRDGMFMHDCDPLATFRYPVPIVEGSSGKDAGTGDYTDLAIKTRRSVLRFWTTKADFRIQTPRTRAMVPSSQRELRDPEPEFFNVLGDVDSDPSCLVEPPTVGRLIWDDLDDLPGPDAVVPDFVPIWQLHDARSRCWIHDFSLNDPEHVATHGVTLVSLATCELSSLAEGQARLCLGKSSEKGDPLGLVEFLSNCATGENKYHSGGGDDGGSSGTRATKKARLVLCVIQQPPTQTQQAGEDGHESVEGKPIYRRRGFGAVDEEVWQARTRGTEEIEIRLG